MTDKERFKIISNEYVDFIIDYNQNVNIFERFPNSTPHIMNDKYAIIYSPAEELNSGTVNRFGYSVIPSCYGLNSEQSLEASGVSRLRRLPAFNLRGKGVLVGIIDTGIDYTNRIFQNMDGTTRILAIWDQTIESERYPGNSYYGTQYLTDEINQALQSENPYEIVPSRDEIGHGTMLAGIAAGSEDSENDFSGVAPDSEIVIVKLKQAKQIVRSFYRIPGDIPCYQDNDIMWAFQYIFDIARSVRRPVAICIGLGSSQGSHNGRSALGSQLSIEGNFPGIVACVAAGNEGDARRHFFSVVDPSVGYSTVELNVGENEDGFTMELWGSAPNSYSIDIMSPTGEYIPRIVESLRINRVISFVFKKTSIIIDYQMVESTTGDQLILIRFSDPTPGIWKFQVYSRGDLQGSFHIWLPMNGFIKADTYFIQSNPYTTVTSPGNSRVPITVTAYNTATNNLYSRSSRGYNRMGVIKPEIAAPGVNIKAPSLNREYTTMTGTSAAAAHTAGIAALILEWGIVRGNYPDIDTVEVKKFMIRGAKRLPGTIYPNRDWGYGILDVYNVFYYLRSEI